MKIRLTKGAAAILRRAFRTGLFGRTPAEAAERLLCEKLRELATPAQRKRKAP